MTYLECYRSLESVEAIKQKVIEDTEVAIFFGAVPERLKAIEDAMNIAVAEREKENETGTV